MALLFVHLRKTRRLYSTVAGMELSKVVGALENIAPTALAEKWDNVGLLVEPTTPHFVKNVILTNDLTEGVMQESIDVKADMIVSYHPPIFRSLKRITSKTWKERIVIKALENRIAVYSPHTASDAVTNGVNDWLASSLGDLSTFKPIVQSTKTSSGGLLFCGALDKESFGQLARSNPGLYETVSSGDFGIMAKSSTGMDGISEMVEKYGLDGNNVRFFADPLQLVPKTGAGRLCNLKQATTLKNVVENIKKYLQINHIRLAIAAGKSIEDPIQTVALCAGSGSSVISGCKADLYLTGEMSHHEVLDATQNGIHVILCEHSNTERGYLHVLRQKLLEILGSDKLEITLSKFDRDPLEIV